MSLSSSGRPKTESGWSNAPTAIVAKRQGQLPSATDQAPAKDEDRCADIGLRFSEPAPTDELPLRVARSGLAGRPEQLQPVDSSPTTDAK